MAELTNKLHIKDTNNNVYECTCYTDPNEAIPIFFKVPTSQFELAGERSGDCWEIKNNNITCYLGLWEVNQEDGITLDYSTPLIVEKNGVQYYVQSQVVNTSVVTIVQSEHQTITFTCDGIDHTSTFEAPVGTSYYVTVAPEVGYTAGSPSTTRGYITNSSLTVTASPASRNTYLVTIPSTNNQTIRVTVTPSGGGTPTVYTSSFTANYGDTYTATVVADEGYVAGTITPASGTITSTLTFTVTEATANLITLNITQPFGGEILVNDKSVGSTAAVVKGSNVKLTTRTEDNFEFYGWTITNAE